MRRFREISVRSVICLEVYRILYILGATTDIVVLLSEGARTIEKTQLGSLGYEADWVVVCSAPIERHFRLVPSGPMSFLKGLGAVEI